MEKFIDYIESQMSGVPDGPFLYKFKRKTLDEMNGRASEVEARGLRDKNVIDDLIISEHPDLKSDYKKLRSNQNARIPQKGAGSPTASARCFILSSCSAPISA